MPGQLCEQRGESAEQRTYGRESGRLVPHRLPDARSAWLSWTSLSLTSLLSTMLLPKGFPSSVCPEYVQFQLWDTSQEACGYFKSILTSKAWLTGLGVGDSSSNVVSALTYTMVIDYTSMVCGLLCATPRLFALFATDMKRWRMAAEALGLLSSLCTILAGVYSAHFIALSCTAGAIGALGSVTGGVSRAPLISHLARAHNEADVSAKEGSQSRLLKLVAIAAGYRFLLWVDAEARRAAAAFVVLVVLKMTFQLRATRLLELRTLNKQRLCILLRAFRRQRAHKDGIGNRKENESMSPAGVAVGERIFRWQPEPMERLHMGASLSDVADLENLNVTDLEYGFVQRGRRYSIHPAAGCGNGCVPKYVAVLAAGAGPHDQLRGFMFLDALLAANKPPSSASHSDEDLYAEVERDFPHFLQALQQNGWETEHLLLGDSEWRIEFGDGHDAESRRSGQRTKAE